MDSVITTTTSRTLERLRDDETAAFHDAIPRSLDWLAQARPLMPNGVPVSWMSGFWRHSPVVVVSGTGSAFTDLDGRWYRDFNLCDLAMAAGFAPEPIVKAISEQAALGNHFLLPTQDALTVSRLLADRFDLPAWQYTLSASGANVDALRVARAFTGRQRVLVFDAKYHGHMDEMLWSQGEPDGVGLPTGSDAHVTTVPFNDIAALDAALAGDDGRGRDARARHDELWSGHADSWVPRASARIQPSPRHAGDRRRHPYAVREVRRWSQRVRP